jgi:hypothetical protein
MHVLDNKIHEQNMDVIFINKFTENSTSNLGL